MSPKISLLIPCHNHAPLLNECLRSIRFQSVNWPYEIIVIDDASKDDVKSVCQQYDAHYYRIDAHQVSAARNFGLRQICDSTVVIFFDADNLLLPNSINRLSEPILTNQADVTYSKRNFKTYDPVLRPSSPYNQMPYTLGDLRIAGQLDTACAVRRTLLPPDPWDESIRQLEDWDFHLTLMQLSARYHFIDEPLMNYFTQPENPHRWYRQSTHFHSALSFIQQKHGLKAMSDDEVTVVITLSGHYYRCPPWKRQLLQLDYPQNLINLLLIDTSHDKQYLDEEILPFIRAVKSGYKGVAVITQEAPISIYSKNRLLRRVLNQAPTDKVLLMSDEVLAPPSTLKQLLKTMSKTNAAIVQGAAPLAQPPHHPNGWQYGISGHPMPITEPRVKRSPSGLAYGQWDYTLINQKQVWPHIDTGLKTAAIEPEIGEKLAKHNQKWLMDWRVKPVRVRLLKSGQTVYYLQKNTSFSPPPARPLSSPVSHQTSYLIALKTNSPTNAAIKWIEALKPLKEQIVGYYQVEQISDLEPLINQRPDWLIYLNPQKEVPKNFWLRLIALDPSIAALKSTLYPKDLFAFHPLRLIDTDITNITEFDELPFF